MVWIVSAIVAIAFAGCAFWVATRPSPSRSDTGGRRFDPARSGFALLAAVVAGVAAVDSYADHTILFQPIVFVLAIGALAATGLAVLPSGSVWSSVRRLASAAVACIWLAVGLAIWPFALMAAGCACTSTGPAYIPPAPLGIETRGWIVLAIAIGPVLLLLAASTIPDRLRRKSIGAAAP